VPTTNITRHRDLPLPESSAKPVEMKSNNDHGKNSVVSALRVSHYIPGQKHYGVMIPELMKQKVKHKFSREVSQTIDITNKHDVQLVKTRFGNDLSLSLSNSTELSPSKPGSEKQHYQFLVEAKESTEEDTEEGFELIPIFSDSMHVEPYIASTKLKVDGVINDDRFDNQDIVRGENGCAEEARTGPDINTTKNDTNFTKTNQHFSDLTDD